MPESHLHFNKQYLEKEIRTLAGQQRITTRSRPLKPVSPILKEAQEVLTEVYRDLSMAAKRKKELSTAGEWVIDNFYVIQEQIVELKEDIPPSYYNKLPHLADGEFAGFPRIYEMIQKLAALRDNMIDRGNATAAVQAFQEVKTLSLGELWAVPIMIRLALIERLSEKSAQLLDYRNTRSRAAEHIDRVVEESTEEPGYLLRKLAVIAEEDREDIHFLTAMAQRLQHLGLLTDTERNWFDYRFRRWNTTLEEQSRIEAQRTSRLHLSIQNAISSLRDVTQTDWSGFVEDNSFVNRILRLDPSGYYQKMDFQTRDRYRKVVERLSARSSLSEIEVARRALLLAERGGQQSGPDEVKRTHIGYYLIDDGYDRLAAEVHYRMPFGERLKRWGEKHSAVYLSAVGLQLIVLMGILSLLVGLLQAPPWLVALSVAASFFPALDLSVTVINRLLTLLLPPRLLPRMDTDGPVADEYRTLVVVPTLLTSPGDARRQLEDLEIRSLANPNRSLQFVLLSDFPDAASESVEGDREILEAAREQVKLLNARHRSRYGDRFFLLHRKRLWNERQNVWMGWERKRGKLEELNELLVNSGAETSFDLITGDFAESIRQTPVRYVITLDADTQLPPGSALELINTAAHPLNRAEVDPSGSIVTSGYGILQPRISILPKSANRTWFARIFSGNVGVDPYTTAVSDVYQDLVGEGVFTGKGLYDVEVFHRVLDGRFPENTVLSHDLLESTYLRCALVTDIELFDDFPTTYLSWSRRNHRWIRGDWQLLRWLFPRTPGGVRPAPGEPRPPSEPNPLSAISRWKIFDNLRRSLNPLFLLIFFLLGWTVLPGSPWLWSLAAFGIVAFPIYSSFSAELFNKPVRVSRTLYMEKIWSNLKLNTVQALTIFLILPHQAWVASDAVLRTLWRLAVSKRNRLEWTSASQTEMQVAEHPDYWERMWANPFWAAASLLMGWYFHPAILFLAVPLALAWAVTPLVVYLLSIGEPTPAKKELNERQRRELRIYSRRTWHFFERYVGEEHRWLPPDNVQEKPWLGAVDRTSPTNMGLALACTCSAHEFGYLTTSEFLDRIERMLEAMGDLELYGGHFYNWYQISSGEVLYPRYISVVDSGNLAGCLIYLRQYLQDLSPGDLPVRTWHSGFLETLWVLDELNAELQENESRPDGFTRTISTLLGDLEAVMAPAPAGPAEWADRLERLEPLARKLSELDFRSFRKTLSDFELEELSHWFQVPLERIRQQGREMERMTGEPAGRREIPAGEVLAESAAEGDAYLPDLPESDLQSQRREELSVLCESIVNGMDFSILYLEDRDLFSIGYNVERASLDKGTYDLLASEARLASFIAIAKGDVPAKHWFRLSRRLTSIRRNEILLSWGGTMFEYLMPLLFMSTYNETLLDNTYENIVVWQQEYATSRGFPWGFSESAYGVLNLELHYQYRTFGAPGLGLRRGLAEDYVVSPYSSMLALMVRPDAAIENLRRLRKEGAYSMNGFYEAVDYTSYRGEKEDKKQIVRMYMAHHQGMSLLALANVLNGNRVQELFHREPLVQSCELLLQERVPRGIPIKEPRPIDVELEPGEEQKSVVTVDHSGLDRLDDMLPRTHFLSNGEYTAMITNRGTGYSWHNEQALTRWKPDRAGDAGGLLFYVKDLESNSCWSVGDRPVKRRGDRYDAWFHPGKVQIARVDEWIESFMEVCVSPEDNIELRKITLTNYSEHRRKLELTSYAEVVLNEREADASHPAFSNLFVQTGHIPEHHALVALRRPRSENESASWLVHTIASRDLDMLSEPLEYETDRFRFTGRGRSLENPAAMDRGNRLSRTVGNVTDPIVSLRKVISLRPGEKISVTFGLGRADSYEEAAAMADHYNNPWANDRVFELASIYGRVELDHIGLTGEQAHYFHRLAGALIYGNRTFRSPEEVLLRNRRTQSGLWAYGISGDYPILLYRISETEQIRHVELLLKAHTLWRLKGLDVDLVIINDHPPSYIDELQETIHQTIRSSFEHRKLNKRGGVFVLRGDSISPEDQVLLQTVAGVVLEGKLNLREFQSVTGPAPEEEPEKTCRPFKPDEMAVPTDRRESDLLFHNGYGGFSRDGKSYEIHLDADPETGILQPPPAPWINVMANPGFGCIATERGSGFTWSRNSRENRLTPWSNDPVSDPAGEAVYILDEERGRFWSPTPGPAPGSPRHTVRHGFGYTRYTGTVMEIEQELTQWVDTEDPVKLVRLRLSNAGSTPRRLTVYRYLEWVLGVSRSGSAPHVITEWDRSREAILARNHYNNEFAGRVAFAAQFRDGTALETTFTGDREEFIGSGSLADPQALRTGGKLQKRFGAGYDPCAASGMSLALEPGETAEICFILGEAESEKKVERLIDTFRDSGAIERSLQEVHAMWDRKLGMIRIDTPAPELNLLVNGWLQYQNIACRMWARSAFYQSGGAFGFRDQLQDAGALLLVDPKMAREQILLHSSRQFEEGDVQHWWHPPSGRGIRSRITDDLLWLPWVTAEYVEATGDREILQESRPFISARALEEGEHEAYLVPEVSGREGTLYEHCCRTIDRSLRAGEHGLPLMGTGDWNDGMNLVGEKGKGESVWLGFFLYDVLTSFLPLCEAEGDQERVQRYSVRQRELKKHLNREGWDGKWFRRAWYDDGTPLGSAENDECRIDAIAQAWSVISGAAKRDKAETALESAFEHLVSESDGIIRLLTPPFDRTDKNPGYIKGYIPGVRENGGQYTHGALWLVKAYAEMGFGGRATRLIRMLSPVSHSKNKQKADRYKVEPFAVSADIYGEPPLTGMGGWTWYTGSAGWMYRVIVESILGLRISGGDTVHVQPSISPEWDQFSMTLKEQDGITGYEITVKNEKGLESGRVAGTMDGKPLGGSGKSVAFSMRSDGRLHRVVLEII